MVSVAAGSSPEVASSDSSTDGFSARARAMPTRWRCPPESWWGYRFALSDRPTRSSRSATRDVVEAFVAPRYSSGRATFCAAVRRESRLADWKTVPMRRRASRSPEVPRAVRSSPLTTTLPDVGRSSRLRQRASVLLPAPDGPTTAKISPEATVNSTSSSTVVGFGEPTPKILVSPTTSIIVRS